MNFMRNGLLVLALLSLCSEMLPRGGGHRGGGSRGGHGWSRHSGRGWSGRSGFRHGGFRHRGFRNYGYQRNWWGTYNWLDPLYFSQGVYSTWSIIELNRRIAELENAVAKANADNRANYEDALDQLREERNSRA